MLLSRPHRGSKGVHGQGKRRAGAQKEAQQGWFESWFQNSPWLTTLLSTLMGPLIILLLLLTFGPCLLNKLLAFIKQRLDTAQLMVWRQQLPRASNTHCDKINGRRSPSSRPHLTPRAPIQQEVAREDRRPLSYNKKAGMKGRAAWSNQIPTGTLRLQTIAVARAFFLIWEDPA